MLMLIFTATATAQSCIGKANFGDDINKVLPLLKEQFGEPTVVEGQSVTYRDKSYRNTRFTRIVFNFRNNRLAEAVFQKAVASKAAATQEVKNIAKQMEKDYQTSSDYDDGAWFYIGGRSPVGMGNLFTVYSRRDNGRWSAVLRYGPFKFK